MPEVTRLNNYPSGQIVSERSREVQYGYQRFLFTAKIVADTTPGFKLETSLKHIRASDWIHMGIWNTTPTELFVPTVNTSNIILSPYTGEQLINESTFPRRVRGEFSNEFKNTAHRVWMTETRNEDTSSHTYIWGYVYNSSRWFDFRDRLGYIVVEAAKEAIELFMDGCPNGIENCATVHFDTPTEHLTTVTGAVVPSTQALILRYIDENGRDANAFFWEYDPVFSRGSNAYTGAREHLGLLVCDGCEIIVHPAVCSAVNRTNGALDGHYCNSCFDSLEFCNRCGNSYHLSQLEPEEEYDEEEAYYFDSYRCDSCIAYQARQQQEEPSLRLNAYSYKPDPIFQITWEEKELFLKKGKRPLYMGMELEAARSSGREGNRQVNEWIASLPRNLFYVKADSSVNYGMEIVTHPFTYKWAMDNFPFEKFDELLRIPNILAKHESAGTHVHVSKNAFTSSHMWKFVLFFLENPDFMGTLGDRGATPSYGPLKSSGNDSLRKQLKQVVESDFRTTTIAGRSGVNLSNDHTIELRFLAGNIEPFYIKKNMQLVQSVYDFTGEVKASDALKGALRDPGYYLGYVQENGYKELVEHMQKAFPAPKKLERTS